MISNMYRSCRGHIWSTLEHCRRVCSAIFCDPVTQQSCMCDGKQIVRPNHLITEYGIHETCTKSVPSRPFFSVLWNNDCKPEFLGNCWCGNERIVTSVVSGGARKCPAPWPDTWLSVSLRTFQRQHLSSHRHVCQGCSSLLLGLLSSSLLYALSSTSEVEKNTKNS